MSEIKHIGRKINILSHKIKRRIGKVSLEYGISSMQAKILGYIFHQAPKRDIFQKTIEEEFDIRRSSVTSVLSLMEKNGLIERVSVCEDARLKKIILTDKGIEVHKSVYKEIETVEYIIYNSLSEEELELFSEILERLSKKIAD
ncbi:MarR family transcriptional regulator [Clostridium sp.]|uniref:MarR family winged helix-turn-helix transcriptional regulator n=1 Tax=Clostridium sp. TaxID=1506 RepID=UPI001ECB3F2B|nr:MarR family transcriptional regulator [Clostridium sp.]MBS5885493.1 MarR family transcriptional regulator [Clostridium sp.]MDU7240618.1 MarR family transcriptional regulator [Clostridium sp.]